MRELTQPGRFRIHQAGMEDLLDLARMKAQAWRESYDFDEAVMAKQESLVELTAENWSRLASEGFYFWAVSDIAGDQSTFVGVANAGAARDEDAPTPLELQMLYLLDVAKGSGIADRLLNMAIGDAPAYLWVLEGNARAIAFYQRHGFTADGAVKEFGGLLAGHRELRMVRD